MSLVRILFLGTPEFASEHLKALLGDEHFKVVGVISQPDRPSGRKMKLTASPVKQMAIQNNIPVISPEKFNSEETYDFISQCRPEAVVVVAYGQILPDKFLKLYPQRVVNVHGSLLPRWRGAAPIQRALMAGDKVTGVCLQVMVKKLDAGDVLGFRKINITDDMNAQKLHDEMIALGADLLHVEFMDYLRGHLAPTPQDESKITYAHKIEKAEGEINWKLPAEEIFHRMQGLSMGPGIFTRRKGQNLKIHEARFEASSMPKAAHGEVIEVDENSFVVACDRSALRVIQVQPESRARMLVGEYLKGYPLKPGERLPN